MESNTSAQKVQYISSVTPHTLCTLSLDQKLHHTWKCLSNAPNIRFVEFVSDTSSCLTYLAALSTGTFVIHITFKRYSHAARNKREKVRHKYVFYNRKFTHDFTFLQIHYSTGCFCYTFPENGKIMAYRSKNHRHILRELPYSTNNRRYKL